MKAQITLITPLGTFTGDIMPVTKEEEKELDKMVTLFKDRRLNYVSIFINKVEHFFKHKLVANSIIKIEKFDEQEQK